MKECLRDNPLYGTYLNRFMNADSFVPGSGNPQLLNRNAFVRNTPLFIDPRGHLLCNDVDACGEPSDVSVKTPTEKYDKPVKFFSDPYPDFDEICGESNNTPRQVSRVLKKPRGCKKILTIH
jgi:hypothetical protein